MPRKKNMNVNVNEQAPEAPAPEAQADQAAPKAEIAKAESKPICLTPGCLREAKIRGVCPRCAVGARKAIKDGKTTWAKLEELGLAIPPKKSAFGGERGVFAKALAAKLAEKKD